MFTETTQKSPDVLDTKLGKMPPKLERITWLNPNDIYPEHLDFLDAHFWKLWETFPEIPEIQEIREKIAIAMNLWKNEVSWEIMKSANNPKYRHENLKSA